MSELDRQLRSDPRQVEANAEDLTATDADADRDTAGGEDYEIPSADVGDSQRGPGLDRMGGYGNRPIPQEGGPNQDH
jgi:hypothetical protein